MFIISFKVGQKNYGKTLSFLGMSELEIETYLLVLVKV